SIRTSYTQQFPYTTLFRSIDWEKLLANKLMVNAVINPITTLFHVPNKEVLTNPYLHHLAEQLCYEAATVLHLEYKTEFEKVKKKIGEHTSELQSRFDIVCR